MNSRVVLLLLLWSAAPFVSIAAESPANDSLANDVWKAHGGENWSKVKELRFTFEVESDGKVLVSAKHDWNVAAGTDRVQWKDKDGNAHDVTTSVTNPPQEGEAKKAYGRWVNDSYWLLAPLKIRDPQVNANAQGTKEMNGTPCEMLHLSFGQVGLTPSDQYIMYVDPQTKLLRAWDYMPKDGQGMQATWENYQTVGGLKLAMEHHFNGKTVRFKDVDVVADK